MISFAEARFAPGGADLQPPEATAHVWDWYCDLSVSFGGMGGTNFHSEIEAFARLTGAEPSPWEVDMLRALFRVHMAALDKRSKQGPQRPTAEASDGAGVKGLLRGMGAKTAKR
ncbi:hypothetical protein [Chelativorans sp.]|uniref:phage tail assembly chaperone n=1 Tax=Chelativorans sp. TaxID=2203393 RepID=UPI002810BAC9|nr:hypothetical protein [Chelativorans sp.]